MAMSVEELAGLVRDESGRIRTDVKELAGTVGELSVKVAAVEAVAQENIRRHSDEIEILFEKDGGKERRLSEVERNYVPRAQHDKDIAEIKGLIREVRDSQAKQFDDVKAEVKPLVAEKIKLGVVVGLITFVATALATLFQGALKFGGH